MERMPVAQLETPEEEKIIEQPSGFEHKSFAIETEEASFQVLFKPQEELVPLSQLEHKSVVVVGETPYARDTKKVKEYFDSMAAHTDSCSLQHTSERYDRKYHFGAMEFTESGRKEYVTETLVTQSPLIPQTDLMSFQIDALQEAGKDGKAEFIINSDAESLVHAADLIAKTYPEAQKGESQIERSIPEIEDYIIAASMDENGKLRDSMDEVRHKVLSALLGDAEAAEYLKNKLEENRSKFEPLKIQRFIEDKESFLKYMEYLKKSAEDAQRLFDEEPVEEKTPGRIAALKNWFENNEKGRRDTENEIAKVEVFLEKYREGNIEISAEDIAELDKYVVVHMTDYYPVYNEKTDEWAIPTHSKATGDRVGRLSVHFSIDGIATATGIPSGTDSWTGKPYAIVAPLGQMILKNGLMDGFMPSDSWWVVDPNDAGVKLPDSATIVAISQKGEGDIQHNLAHRDGKGIDQTTVDGGSADAFAKFVKEKYGAKLETLGNDTWIKDEKVRQSKSLFEIIQRNNPFIWNGRHSDSPEERFERSMLRYLNEGLTADNNGSSPEKALDAERKSLLNRQPRIAREFARQMVKVGIL